uniref:Uncharacterized protein n=1 Tax=Oryza nivara TaxID=4536 RepID=A0A0E0IHR5_ORYNI
MVALFLLLVTSKQQSYKSSGRRVDQGRGRGEEGGGCGERQGGRRTGEREEARDVAERVVPGERGGCQEGRFQVIFDLAEAVPSGPPPSGLPLPSGPCPL